MIASFTTDFSTPAATPSFSPAGGTYSSDQSVTIGCTTAGATIYYTTDGSTPTTSSTQYTGAIAVAGHGTVRTIKAIAIATGFLTSAAGSATYMINYPAAATPFFNPVGGIYTSDQSVTISCTTSGTTIYYTTDGSTPTTSSTQYTGAIAVNGHGTVRTIKAIATVVGYSTSAVASAAYTINYPAAATPTFNPAGGTYTSDQSVTISCTTSGATIYYTTDGSTPTTSSMQYTGAIAVAGHGTVRTIKAIAIATGFLTSAAGSATYTINYPAAATPTFNPVGGIYSSDQSVTISCTTSGATIYYTTDGSTATTSSSKYVETIVVSGHGMVRTIKAIAIATGSSTSGTGSATYTISYPPAATPTFSLAGGTYASDQVVTINCTTEGATIYYTTDGSTPTTSSSPYVGTITIAGHGTARTIKAIAIASGFSTSTVASATYTISYPAVAVPTFNPSGGTYSSDQNVTISCTSAGATIYFTTDGSSPTTSSAQYSSTIPVTGHGTVKTIKAIAIAAGYSTSAVGSATYTISYPAAATPTFNPSGGKHSMDQTVFISCATEGATIYYTTDGSDPLYSSTRLSGASPIGPITATINPSTTIRSRAVAPLYSQSNEGYSEYRDYYGIGDTGPAGGIIFYDKGSYTDGWRWLESWPSDRWHDTTWAGLTIKTGATATGIGSGKSNTAIIISVLSKYPVGSAAEGCAQSGYNGFDDWFLPSLAELNLMYENKDIIGGFLNAYYWSSSEDSPDGHQGRMIHFETGYQNMKVKTSTCHTRAIRSF